MKNLISISVISKFSIVLITLLFVQNVNALFVNVGGRVLVSIPCIDPPGTFWTLTLKGGIIPVPIIYTYLPPVFTRPIYLPGLPTVNTLGKAVPGVCTTTTVPPVVLAGLRTFVYGSSY